RCRRRAQHSIRQASHGKRCDFRSDGRRGESKKISDDLLNASIGPAQYTPKALRRSSPPCRAAPQQDIVAPSALLVRHPPDSSHEKNWRPLCICDIADQHRIALHPIPQSQESPCSNNFISRCCCCCSRSPLTRWKKSASKRRQTCRASLTKS